jgi:hypothetical protein
VIFLATAPLLAVLQQAALLGSASLLRLLAEWIEGVILPRLPIDPVYGGAGLRVLGGISPCGLAIAGDVGRALHRLAPGLFGPARSVGPDVFVSALLAPGATVSARAICAVLATAVLIVVVRLVRRRVERPWSGSLSVLIQAYLLLDLARECAFNLRELEATGLPFALAALSPVDAGGQRELLTRQLDHLPVGVIGLACALAAVGACLAIVRLVESTARLMYALLARRWPRPALPRLRIQIGPAVRTASLGLARVSAAATIVTTTVVSPLSQVTDGQPAVADVDEVSDAGASASSPEQTDDPALMGAAEVAAPTATIDASVPASTATPPSTQTPTTSGDLKIQALATGSRVPAQRGPTSGVGLRATTGGSVVTLEGSGYQYTLLVDGSPTIVKGMGYNPWYANLPVEERKARYDRDFAAMQAVGVNALEGWFQDQFDEVTLEAANRHGLRVIMPFELNQDYDYSDPAVKERFRREVRDWVLRYRDNPAVLMWGPGNEVMHRLIFPTAVQGKQDAAQEARADAYGAFYVELMDMVHDLDPNHPVIYRDAEDLYFARFRTALQRDGVTRPWFIYGTNVYTKRLATVIDNWPNQGVDAPLLVSEFSPGGVGPADRPGMFGWYWSTIRAHPKMVLGGVVYTWATQGPEDLDRVFGLTDPDGNPVDGSVEALGKLFHQ